MSCVYRLKTVPLWNTIATPLDFFGTALLTGPVALAVLNRFVLDTVYESCLLLLICSNLGLCLKLTALFVRLKVQRRSKDLFWYKTLRNKADAKIPIYVFQACLYITGVALFAMAFTGLTSQASICLLLSFCVILIIDMWNRFCFYDSFCRLGL